MSGKLLAAAVSERENLKVASTLKQVEPRQAEISFDFRQKLNNTLEGFRHNYCYQCGACVADCPAARYVPEYNPRLILLEALLGFEEELIGENSIIWLCTNCYNCFERCPQDVRPVEIIIALKNLSVERGTNPEEITKISDSVLKVGSTTFITPLVDRRRKELGLPSLKEIPVEELKEILED
jgi:heterodisulfide reductase subunit C